VLDQSAPEPLVLDQSAAGQPAAPAGADPVTRAFPPDARDRRPAWPRNASATGLADPPEPVGPEPADPSRPSGLRPDPGPRPRRRARPGPRRNRGAAPAGALLTELAADPAAGGQWAAVIADLAAQHARRKQLLAALDANPGARFARGALARHIQVRDRRCCHPGCTRPAAAPDLDHTRDHAAGGPTTTANIDPNCTRHHWYKTALGWQLRQPEPGLCEWTSPLGQVYRTRGQPVRPDLPEPLPAGPRPGPRPDPDYCYPDGPTLRRPPKLPEPPPPRPPPRPPDDDPPPF
jgi:hypothetical protein